MAELATIARPYAEALFKTLQAKSTEALGWLDVLAAFANDAQMRALASNPTVTHAQVAKVLLGASGAQVPQEGVNLVDVLAENGRLSVLPEIASQFRALANKATGLAEGVVYTAFELDAAALTELSASLEKRFARRLSLTQVLDKDLIGGIRVVVGDEVLDTSIKARLEQMQVTLTA
jgi:F-type H+-transporting ATPase subunit delta